jgi:alpha-galactosidase
VIQIDDGYQSDIGDWLTVGPEFSSGMQFLADQIHGAGYSAGLWLAPFIALASSRTVRQNPDWILRTRQKHPCNTGLVWNQFGRALDPSHPGFLEYLERVIRTAIHSWGYDYLKLDFLYAGVLPGRRHNPKLTRAQAFSAALDLIRSTAGESTVLVGCGCPLGPGIGIFDAMRISPDVAPSWKPRFSPFSPLLKQEPTLPAAVNAIRNTLTRAVFHRRWWINDPDCLLIRECDSNLTLDEVHSLTTAIGLSGGSVVLSDRFASLGEERMEILGRLIPPLSGQMRLLSPNDAHDHPLLLLELEGVMGRWWLVGCFNTLDTPYRFSIPTVDFAKGGKDLHVFDVWQQQYNRHQEAELLECMVDAHQVRLLAIRQASDQPAWIGDTVHLSQGRSVSSWRYDENKLRLEIDPGRHCEAAFWLYLPGKLKEASVDGRSVNSQTLDKGIYRFEYLFQDRVDCLMEWL